jgi:hypothetical protein
MLSLTLKFACLTLVASHSFAAAFGPCGWGVRKPTKLRRSTVLTTSRASQLCLRQYIAWRIWTPGTTHRCRSCASRSLKPGGNHLGRDRDGPEISTNSAELNGDCMIQFTAAKVGTSPSGCGRSIGKRPESAAYSLPRSWSTKHRRTALQQHGGH